MHLGLQDDVARAAHVLDACPSAVTSETLLQLQVTVRPMFPASLQPLISNEAQHCITLTLWLQE